MRALLRAAAFLSLALATAPLLAAGTIDVVHPWARPTIPDRPGVVYLGIHNGGDTADRLTGARAARADKVEMHVSAEKDGVMTMTPVDSIEIPAGGMAHLGPGGLHLMLFGLDQPLKAGDSLALTLVFEKAGEIAVAVPVTRGMGGTHGQGHGHGDQPGADHGSGGSHQHGTSGN